jgi:pyruvate/2-oxoglutarate dehydrogenase complex dihydrolipoamide dehydrogenase (E3) component
MLGKEGQITIKSQRYQGTEGLGPSLIGLNEMRAKKAGIEYSVFTEAFRDNDRSLAEGERIGRVKMLLDKHEKPIGVQILGPQAGELLSEWVAGLKGKVKLPTLASAMHP